jgi:hypothetical protein
MVKTKRYLWAGEQGSQALDREANLYNFLAPTWERYLYISEIKNIYKWLGKLLWETPRLMPQTKVEARLISTQCHHNDFLYFFSLLTVYSSAFDHIKSKQNMQRGLFPLKFVPNILWPK